MCTVSILRINEMIRIACNRDEQRTRLPALSPTLQQIHHIRAIMPTDANAGGTWIGVNEFGVAMALLNMNSAGASAHTISRGLIIPSLMHSATTQVAVEVLSMQTLTRYNPFRLILIDADRTIECRVDGATLTTRQHGRLKTLMFTSSGLGDHVVDLPRRRLFRRMLARPSAAAQDAFHRHSWEGQTHLSVCMRRTDAMTVSSTTVSMSPSLASMQYRSGPPDLTEASTVVSLPTCQLRVA